MTFLHPEMCPNIEAFRVVKHASRWDRLGARNEGEESKLFSLDVSQIGAKKIEKSEAKWGKSFHAEITWIASKLGRSTDSIFGFFAFTHAGKKVVDSGTGESTDVKSGDIRVQ